MMFVGKMKSFLTKKRKSAKQSLLARLRWRMLLYPNSLCAKVLLYLRGNLLDIVPNCNISATWQSIMYGLELLKKSFKELEMSQHNWIPRQISLKVVTRCGRLRI